MALGTNQLGIGFVAAVVFASAFAGCLDRLPLEVQDWESPSPSPSEAAMEEGNHVHEAPSEEWDPDSPPELSHEAPFDLEDGRIPTKTEAKEFPNKYSRFVGKGNGGFEQLRSQGFLSGNGSTEDPYVLEEFYVDGELSLTSADKAIIIRNGYVNGQFKLNYIGERVYVHHVFATDLRVNENIKRDGPNTGGLFHDNKFAFVGQIRHFVGEFMENEIGPRPHGAIQEYVSDTGISKVPVEIVFNFDGFHGADVHHNLFIGQVDIKLHGHNHADCFVCPIHDHDDETQFPEDEEPSDEFRSRHSTRYVSLLFRDNEIRVPGGVALRYNDRNHAGDDRTANSEPNKYLNDAHVHYQDVTIRDNRLVGGRLFVDVFNAADERHTHQNLGVLRIWDNEITVRYDAPQPTSPGGGVIMGVLARTADGLELRARGNTITFQEVGADQPGSQLAGALAKAPELRGFQLEAVDDSNLTLEENVVMSGRLGVYALTFSDSTYWKLLGNDFRTQEAWRGKDVQHAPEESP